MKLYLLSDNVDTQTGMRLVGIDGVVVHTPEEIRTEMDKVMDDKDIGIVLVTEKLIDLLPDYFSDIKINKRLPLVVEIPDRHGSIRDGNSIMSYVSNAIGLKL